MKLILSVLLAAFTITSFSQQKALGVFKENTDVGKPKISGSTDYDAQSQTYLLKGAGYNIWFNRDEFQYLYKKVKGDFLVTANFQLTGNAGNAHRKLGWMLRESLDENAASYNATVHGDGLTTLQWRSLKGAFMRDPEDEIFFPKKNQHQVIQMQRVGEKLTMRVANWGEPLQEVGATEITGLNDSVFVGVFVCSHNADSIAEAKIWNVRFDQPINNQYNPNPAIKAKEDNKIFGCRLEIMTIADGKRKVIRESDGRFEAPNWMPDGKKLLYNEGGYLYTISIEGGEPEKLNTGDINKNNNDHGISFDGKTLAISHHRPGLNGGGSTVYVLPLKGGEPKQVTQETPSYWHGWAPGAKALTIVAQRNGSSIYNLYKVEVNTGKETALTTNATGHVDGPEYSPDGKYIYYNANPTGTMQVWRMKPDGAAKEQVTFGAEHSWFPHISPDGKWIAFISFPNNIEPNSHPSYKMVTLSIMPAAGGAPKVVAYLYGGQGTINVNSWSPDSKSIAFVSNSAVKE